ncbi:concanavalin A-like lectin/glucanase domain-containing protein [Triangularia verruculosa]|uniref:Concanavalin A-like lectin/glucanase domain-containing protein n=1 Tax=Triangularia verruculosa TaxID=2587418 RepID=A0AAN6XRB6_9PEZI|nr:concanavalin A-like lectin/glucanase domain-containing protein [Triangularia verruculosa]
MRIDAVALASLLSTLASAGAVPNYPGYRTLWSDNFAGAAGQKPDSNLWNTITNLKTNNDLQEYTTSNSNLQLSGGGTVQIIPRLNRQTNTWTSARIETKAVFTPAANKITIFEGSIRFGDHPVHLKQGIWPAFWMLGKAIHQGTPWPQCGELDIMETINGVPTAYGTVHCGSFPGGPCNEPIGRHGTTGITPSGWHTYRIKVDRTAARSGGRWEDEVIDWEVDGRPYYSLRGSEVGDQGVWGTLAHSPMFLILNVAVGGDWPGAPNAQTQDSYGSMMEAEYVAVYSS